MKPIRMLFMLVACMAAFTVTATTTAKPEQKQKAELVKELAPIANTVSVVTTFEIVSVQTDANVFQGNQALIYVKSYEPLDYAIVMDVGWRNSKKRFNNIHYKEKLFDNYNKGSVYLAYKANIPIRSNC